MEAFDAKGNPCLLADNLVHFALKGPAEIAGVGNGNPLSLEPFQADYRKLFKDINGGEPPDVVGVTFYINAHNTKTRAESRFCDAYFTKN